MASDPFILVQGNVRHDRERAMKLAAVLAVIAGLIELSFGPPPMAVTVAVITFILGSIGIYNNIKETIRVQDMLDGRHFSCRSITTLLQKQEQIGEMGETFTRFLERLKNWGGRQVIEMAPDRPPIARFVERPHAAE